MLQRLRVPRAIFLGLFVPYQEFKKWAKMAGCLSAEVKATKQKPLWTGCRFHRHTCLKCLICLPGDAFLLYFSVEHCSAQAPIRPNTASHSQSNPAVTTELLNKVKEMLQKQYKTRFVIKVGEHLKSIAVEDILFFYSLEKATFLCTSDFKTYLVDYSLDRISEMVDEHQFFRINRKYILSNRSIADIVFYSNSRLKVKLKKADEENIVVSRDKVAAFKEWLDL